MSEGRAAQIVAICNQKGGVGKTTIAYNLAAGLAGTFTAKVLAVDLDGQCSLTSIALRGEDGGKGVFEVMKGEARAADVIRHVPSPIGEEYDLLAGNEALNVADALFQADPARAHLVEQGLAPIRDRYDWIIIDTPPSLGTALMNGLTAADFCVVVCQADKLSLDSLSNFYKTFAGVKTYCNRGLNIDGILLNRYDPRLCISRLMAKKLADAANVLQTRIYAAKIRECVAVKEAQAKCKPVTEIDEGRNNAAKDLDAFIGEAFRSPYEDEADEDNEFEEALNGKI